MGRSPRTCESAVGTCGKPFLAERVVRSLDKKCGGTGEGKELHREKSCCGGLGAATRGLALV
jgi:hypothetical protein